MNTIFWTFKHSWVSLLAFLLGRQKVCRGCWAIGKEKWQIRKCPSCRLWFCPECYGRESFFKEDEHCGRCEYPEG
jgi:hypothetical protein